MNMNITKNYDFQFSCKEETKCGLNKIDDYYVMIIQKGESIEDKIYNIYDNCSMLCFDDKIGMYYQSDYEDTKKQDHETRSPIYPCKNLSIKRHDYYSILGVDRCASEEEIKRNFRVLIMQVHPDFSE